MAGALVCGSLYGGATDTSRSRIPPNVATGVQTNVRSTTLAVVPAEATTRAGRASAYAASASANSAATAAAFNQRSLSSQLFEPRSQPVPPLISPTASSFPVFCTRTVTRLPPGIVRTSTTNRPGS